MSLNLQSLLRWATENQGFYSPRRWALYPKPYPSRAGARYELRGKSVSWDSKTKGWQTGITNENRSDDISFYPASKVIDNDNMVDWGFINLVKSILQTRAEELIVAKVLALFTSNNSNIYSVDEILQRS